jgi:hypothetical protein
MSTDSNDLDLDLPKPTHPFLANGGPANPFLRHYTREFQKKTELLFENGMQIEDFKVLLDDLLARMDDCLSLI